jgi:hypothetical protein
MTAPGYDLPDMTQISKDGKRTYVSGLSVDFGAEAP